MARSRRPKDGELIDFKLNENGTVIHGVFTRKEILVMGQYINMDYVKLINSADRYGFQYVKWWSKSKSSRQP